jgi:hypothetical protein
MNPDRAVGAPSPSGTSEGGLIMIDSLNDYLQYVYNGHKYAYALLVLLTTTAAGVGMEALTQILAAKTKI